jgi:xanthine dehydrogenase FAD-binding subunit
MGELSVIYPESEDVFLSSLDEHSAVLNGGTDIHVKLRAGKWSVSRLVSLERIDSLTGISEEGKYVRIRCRTTFSELLGSILIKERFPLLWKAVYEIGSTQIRNRGTLTGNVVNASPAGDGILALSLYDAWLEIRSNKGQVRLAQIHEFIIGPGKTVLKAGEFVHSVILQKPDREYRTLFYKIGQRKAMAIAIASMGVLLEKKNDRIKDIRIAFGSVAPTVVRVRSVEEKAFGSSLNDVTIGNWRKLLDPYVIPIDDVRSTAAYRKEVCSRMLYKILDM